MRPPASQVLRNATRSEPARAEDLLSHALNSEATLPIIQHQVVKPRKLVNTALGLLEQV
ncbi:hypothetical protein OIE61_39195 [Streptomyces sp. NBC_01762]|uniref:hypothetical protein n=1 Tax=unclassified Streptomyces TaxID=2593676 RepID=UPI002DD966CA|nr:MULTISPECIES: hypothetical protein [unclassified Streptomyces]WSC49464.1 hypothetical protein OIE61_39195 [Streptomyces sp. NBC_01762]WSD30496.1 hypothetical protein OHA26_39505 [Streptomyces sp. NBC_01751]